MNRIRSSAAGACATPLLSCGRVPSVGRRQVYSVGDDAVAPAVEAPSRPGGRLGDGDAGVQAVHPPTPAERDGRDPVREDVLGVGVEGADEREIAGRAESVPGHDRDDRLVDVRDVVAAVAKLSAQGEDRVGRERVFETAPLAGMPTVRPSETNCSDTGRLCGRAPRCRRADSASSGSNGARIRGS